MNKQKDIRGSILDPNGKAIRDDPVGFRQHMKGLLVELKPAFPYRIKDQFSEAMGGQRQFASIFAKGLASGEPVVYTKDYLHCPWPRARIYQKLHELFLFQPAFSEPFLSRINQYFYHPVLQSWKETQRVSYFPRPTDYCARALPGTSSIAGNVARQNASWLQDAAGEVLPSRLGGTLIDRLGKLFNKRWDQYGGSLFPLGYLMGKNTYGRLRSIPGSTVCNMDHGVKETILGAVKSHVGVSFMEVDLKSCHGVIFEDLFDWDRFDRADLPSLNLLWPEMIKDFWAKADTVVSHEHIRVQVERWGDDLLKGLLKNQFYKALNGGQPDYSDDNVERSKIKLKIKARDQADFNAYFHLVFSQMKVFTLETNFKEQLNSFPLLYLPNKEDGFRVNTLSNRQSRQLLSNPEAVFRSQTANS